MFETTQRALFVPLICFLLFLCLVLLRNTCPPREYARPLQLMPHAALNKQDFFQLSSSKVSVQLFFANEPFLRLLTPRNRSLHVQALNLLCKDPHRPSSDTCAVRSLQFFNCPPKQEGKLLSFPDIVSHCTPYAAEGPHWPHTYLGASLPIDLSVEFQNFKAKFNKTFGTEDDYRYYAFCENFFKAMLLQYYDQGTAEYGVTEFFHYTQSEFARIYLNQPVDLSNRPADKIVTYPSSNIPDNFDWRDKGAVSEVKNQGNCGSCWAFSAIGNIEGQWFLRRAELLSLSEQELVDCDKNDNGCAGGFMTTAFKAVEDLGGLETEDDYPYKADTKKCSFDRSKARVYINGSAELSQNETELAAWLTENGPISVGINALPLMFYIRGIVHLPSFLCPSFMIDHGVLLVGYGVGPTIMHSHVPYWIVKNSWGKSWGEAGYFRIHRGSQACGVNQMCSTSIVK
uniref:Cathepsin L n=1 Tax=Schistocephalus solidus TaxID=70667 RepID=A0A0X3PSP8_SCHSO